MIAACPTPSQQGYDAKTITDSSEDRSKVRLFIAGRLSSYIAVWHLEKDWKKVTEDLKL